MSLQVLKGTETVLEDAGGTISAGGYVAAADTDLLATVNPNYPHMMVVVEVTFGTTAPTAGIPVSLFKRSKAIDGTNDEAVPSDDNPDGFLESKTVAATTSEQRWTFDNLPRDIWHDMTLYVYNGDDTQSITAFRVVVTPFTYEDV